MRKAWGEMKGEPGSVMHHPLIEALLGLLFPDRCAGCRRLGGLLCVRCTAALTPYPGRFRRPLTHLSEVRIAYVFASPIREAIHELKYRRQRRVARALGGLLAAHLHSWAGSISAVVAVPMHAERLRERGFNQAEALAREAAAIAGVPFCAEGLVRVRATVQQAQLNARERQNNVLGAFAWQGGTPPSRVVLIDDVLTTGATMDACAASLLAAGAERVYGLALARSRPELT